MNRGSVRWAASRPAGSPHPPKHLPGLVDEPGRRPVARLPAGRLLPSARDVDHANPRIRAGDLPRIPLPPRQDVGLDPVPGEPGKQAAEKDVHPAGQPGTGLFQGTGVIGEEDVFHETRTIPLYTIRSLPPRAYL